MTRLLRWLFAPCCTRLAVAVAFIMGNVAALTTLWVGIVAAAGIGAVYGALSVEVPRLLSRRNGKVT